MRMVAVEESYMALLEDFSRKTKIPVERCVGDALFDWVGSVAPLVLECLGLPPLQVREEVRNVRSTLNTEATN